MITVESLDEIKKEIEKLREKLGNLLECSENFNSIIILNISRDLDKLILKFLAIK